MKETLLDVKPRKVSLHKDGRLSISIPRAAVEHTRLRPQGRYRLWITSDGGLRIEPVKGG